MQQLLSVWALFDLRKRVIVVLATVAMFAAVLGLSRMASQPSMALLYAGLEPAVAGDVIKALEARGAQYEVRGGAVYVRSSERDKLRMGMASEGLPAQSSGGYEILDNLSGFGTTSQMFNAAYWRAQEGELARTIVANPLIQAARVHLGSPNPQSLRQRAVPTASVTVTTTNGTLSSDQAKALKYMIASAVPGLLPENVSVIDTQGGLILANDELQTSGSSGSDRAESLQRNVERLLEARVGFGNAIVEVSVDTVTDRESIIERTIDPDSRIAISSETEESSVSTTDSRGTGVSVASNLPSGEGAADGKSTSSNSETRERLNYEISETTRELIRMPGAIRRITVAVLVDGIRSTDDTGQQVWTPRSSEEMDSLRELVASTVGFDETRGDVITLKSLEFENVAVEGDLITPGFLQTLNIDVMSLIQLAVLAIVALILGLFVLRPLLSKEANGPALDQAMLPGSTALGAAQSSLQMAGSQGGNAQDPDALGMGELPALTGEIDDGIADIGDLPMISDLDFAIGNGGELASLNHVSADPVDRLRALIEERQTETVEILRGWMENEEEPA